MVDSRCGDSGELRELILVKCRVLTISEELRAYRHDLLY